MNLILSVVSTVLFTVVGGSLAYLAVWPIGLGAAAGLALGLLPPALRAIRPQTQIIRSMEMLSIFLLVVISIVVSWHALIPLLNEDPVQIEKTLPALITTIPLYVLYLLLNRNDATRREVSMSDKLAALFSGPPLTLTFVMSVTIATYTLLLFHYLGLNHPNLDFLAVKFLQRGIIPPLTVFLFCWGLLMIINKTYILWRERKMLNGDGPMEKKSILLQTYYRSLQDTGAATPDSYLDLLWKKSADFYIIPRYINWAIPILGFIGTVLGISLAADGIQNIINTQSNISQLSSELGQAIAPLGIAFDTTLIALSLSVVLMLIQTALQRWEDNLLVDYENRIRSMPLSNL